MDLSLAVSKSYLFQNMLITIQPPFIQLIYSFLLSLFRWLEYRTKAEIFYGLPVQKEVCSRDERYSRMDLSRAIVPPQFFLHPVYPDDSPDELLPIGYNGYTGTEYL